MCIYLHSLSKNNFGEQKIQASDFFWRPQKDSQAHFSNIGAVYINDGWTPSLVLEKEWLKNLKMVKLGHKQHWEKEL